MADDSRFVEFPDHWLIRAPPELIGIIGLAAVLRLYQLGRESLWLDEAYSVGIVQQRSVLWLLFEHPTYDTHPPLFYVLLKPWIAFFGNAEFAVRLYAVVFGVATVVAIYYLGRELFTRRIATVAALFVTVSPFHIWHSQTVRMYTLLTFLTALSILTFVRVLRTRSRRRVIAYLAVTTALGYTHVYGLFVITAQVTYLLTRPYFPGDTLAADPRDWTSVYAGLGIVLSPWLLELLSRVIDSLSTPSSYISWIPQPDITFFLDAYTLYISGTHLDWRLDPAIPAVLTFVLAFIAGICLLLALARVDRSPPVDQTAAPTVVPEDEPTGIPIDYDLIPKLWLLVLVTLIPLVVPFLISTVITPVLILRYTIPATIGFYLLLARGTGVIRTNGLGTVVIAVLILGLLVPLPAYYAADQKGQWREATTYIGANTDGDDLVILSPGYTWWAYGYYADGGTDTHAATGDTTPTELAAMIEGYDQVFLVFRYPGPETRAHLRTILEQTQGVQLVTERSYVVVTVLHYSRANTPVQNTTTRTGTDRLPGSRQPTNTA